MLEDYVNFHLYLDNRKTGELEKLIYDNREEITILDDMFTIVKAEDIKNLNDGDCIIVYSTMTDGLKYGPLIKNGSQYKIRYLDRVSNRPLNRYIEHPPINITTIPMFALFRKYNEIYANTHSMKAVEEFFVEKKSKDGKQLYEVELKDTNNINIKYFGSNNNINITNKTDEIRIGHATDESENKYDYYWLNGIFYMEKIYNLTDVIENANSNLIKIYKKNTIIRGTIFDLLSMSRKRNKPDRTYKNAGGRRKYKRKSVKKIGNNKIRKGKKRWFSK